MLSGPFLSGAPQRPQDRHDPLVRRPTTDRKDTPSGPVVEFAPPGPLPANPGEIRIVGVTLGEMPDLFENVVNLAKRRGFVFPSSEIYGGFRSTYDYGPLGVLMKRNLMEAWWRAMVQERDDIVGLDAAILMAPRVWEASGHVATFTDPLVDCRNCKSRWREDELVDGTCLNCGSGDLTPARAFNLMFKTHVGPVEDDASVTYLRPETAQGIFVNFANVLQTSRKKPPFGIAQQGKSFRNEITPGNFIFRTREFEQMEMEYFVPPDEAPKWFEYWCAERLRWYTDLGIPAEQLRLRMHDPDELSHYSAATADVEFLYPWGWGELEGIANRTDYDLKQHAEFSGERLEYFDQASGERYVPHVIEPAAGVGRPLMAAVLPLSKNERLVPTAREVFDILKPHFMCDYDETQAIGRRYRRQDEIGTPYCVTVDFDSIDDRAVTVRERDSMTQDRVSIDKLVEHLREKLS
jgi:glycyl-tRNA synthetase